MCYTLRPYLNPHAHTTLNTMPKLLDNEEGPSLGGICQHITTDKPEPTDCKICGYDDGHKKIDDMCISCYYDDLYERAGKGYN